MESLKDIAGNNLDSLQKVVSSKPATQIDSGGGSHLQQLVSYTAQQLTQLVSYTNYFQLRYDYRPSINSSFKLWIFSGAMEDIPDDLLVEILDRIDSAADLARCRLVCKRLCSASYKVHSIYLRCSHHRFLLQNSDPTEVVPFKSLLKNLVSLFDRRNLQYLSVGFERPFAVVDDGNEIDERDDFWLTEQDYFASLLSGEMGSRLVSLVVSDFWPQACWRRSTILELLSTACKNLGNLEVRNAWLCVKDLKPMLMLRSLSLDNIALVDEDLDKINECFPFLEFLDLFWIDGLNNPKIQHQTLKTCYWTVIDYHAFSFTICAPLLTKLRLSCAKPNHVILQTPELHRLELVVEEDIEFIKVEAFLCLRSLCLKAPVIGKLLPVFSGLTVDSLDVEVVETFDPFRSIVSTDPEDLIIRSFPAATSLNLGPGGLSKLERSFLRGCLSFESLCQSLRKLMVHLPDLECEFFVLSSMISACPLLNEVVIIFPNDTPSDVWNNFTSNFASKYPKIKWKRQLE